jgi:DDE superfamily endonuclease
MGAEDRIVVADAGYGDVTSFREELEKRQLRYAVGSIKSQAATSKCCASRFSLVVTSLALTHPAMSSS